ncbi:hypothetical protein B0A52_08737 [Exophiala mesophila]|uniref:Ribosome maturation protein SDO1/SBDS N-terminal domain-containing protein n=1 Tax=Exophiala mesophila TaxID=212818 RepID=A0A438MWT6_EXOME|nr:hypothetical protein B0A52_08737 [Exophiala mesophila]
MPRGNGPVTKVFYKGSTDDFIVFVESAEGLEAWKSDKSIPLVQVVDSFKVLVSHKHGAQGELDTASKATLENEFGTSNEDEVVKKILEEGQLQTSTQSQRTGVRNETMGPHLAFRIVLWLKKACGESQQVWEPRQDMS